MRILVVGAGAYVLGRGTAGLGTVLPALAQASKTNSISEVVICSTSERGRPDVEQAAADVNRRLGSSLKVTHGVLDSVLPRTRLTPSFDCAIISVPDDLHFTIAERVLRAGLHCLLVKPFVPTVDEGKQLTQLAERYGLYAAVEFHKRLDDANRVVRRMVEDGSIGSLAYATVEYSQRITVPRDLFATWAARTNVFEYLGVHYVDLLYFLTAYRPRRVTAIGRRGVLSALGIDTYDSVHAIVEWDTSDSAAGKFVSQFAIGWIDPEGSTAMSDQRYVLVGSTGRIECDQKHRGLRLVGGAGRVDEVNPYFSEYLAAPGDSLEFSGYGLRSVATFIEDVRDVQRGRGKPGDLEGRRPTFRNALVSTAVLEAARKSLLTGGEWKEVDEVT